MRSMRARVWLIASGFLVLLSVPAGADSFISLEGYPYEIERSLGLDYADPDLADQADPILGRVRNIIYPVLGFPSIVEPGDTIGIVVILGDPAQADESQPWSAELATQYTDTPGGGALIGDPVKQTYPLHIEEVVYDEPSDSYILVSRVDPGTPMDSYSLVVRLGDVLQDIQPAAVSVQRAIDGTFRVVHLTSPQLGSLKGGKDYGLNSGTYPANDPGNHARGALLQAVAEVSLLRPAFAVVTGNLVDGSDYESQLREVYDVFRNLRAPAFLLPGARDGMVFLDALGEQVKQDGLSGYRRWLGPAYYSFDYGALHVVCVNTYDGTQDRRQARTSRLLGTEARNAGGQLSQAQLRWLEADVRAATAAGKYIWVFMHHDPRGPYKKNKPAGGIWLGLGEPPAWNYDSEGWDSDPSDDIFNETENDNTGVRALQILAENNVVAVFLGQPGVDAEQAFHTGQEILSAKGKSTGVFAQRPIRFISTTVAASQPPDRTGYWGYRVIEVTDHFITRIDYADDSVIDSVPLGNTWFEAAWGTDGMAPYAGFTVANGLPRTVVGTARLFARGSGTGYRLFDFTTGEEIPFKDVGITGDGGVVLYATVRAEGLGSFPAFPSAPYAENRVPFVLEPSPTNRPPVPVIEILRDPADSLHVQFRADQTTDPDGSETIWRYDWYPGDGAWRGERVFEYRYEKAGRYPVVLIVTDDHGAQATATTSLRVGPVPETDEDEGCGLAGGRSGPGALWPLLAVLLLLAACKRRTV